MAIAENVNWNYQREHNLILVNVDLSKANSEAWFLLTSDVHWDNTHCNRRMLKKHLDQAAERGAGIIDNGDLFCAMQGKWDGRADQNQLRPEHAGNNYFDALVDTAAEYYAPYADQIMCLGHGNHETNVIKRHQRDLTKALRDRLQRAQTDAAGGPVICHEIEGFVRFKVNRGGRTHRIVMWRHHGYGGGGQSRGILKAVRSEGYCSDAHITLTGHDHCEFITWSARPRITSQDRCYWDEICHVKVPGYKGGQYFKRNSEWASVKGFRPTTNAGAWLRLYREFDPDTDQVEIKFDVQRAH